MRVDVPARDNTGDDAVDSTNDHELVGDAEYRNQARSSRKHPRGHDIVIISRNPQERIYRAEEHAGILPALLHGPP